MLGGLCVFAQSCGVAGWLWTLKGVRRSQGAPSAGSATLFEGGGERGSFGDQRAGRDVGNRWPRPNDHPVCGLRTFPSLAARRAAAMIGKKRSGFQITSVTMDYEGGKEPANGVPEPGGGAAQLANGETGKPGAEPGGGPARGLSETVYSPQQLVVAAAAAAAAAAAQDVAPKAGTTPSASCSSRFRLVKLDHALGEPYRRGRWTCSDLYSHDADGHLLAKVLDGARHVNSLDSHLEVSGLAHRAVGLLRLKSHAPKSQGFLPASPGNTLSMLLQAARTLHAGEARLSPALLGIAGLSRSDSCLPATPAKEQQQQQQRPGTARQPGHNLTGAASNQASPNVSQPTSGEHGAIRKFSESGSSPASPVSSARDGSPARRNGGSGSGSGSLRFLSPMHSLASSMLSVGAHQDGDDDSGSGSSMVAIDNKIEQAMDLVKSHLMYAVREEVELLKEQIKELLDRNGLLEQENALLKSLADPDQLAQLPPPARAPPSSSATPPSTSPSPPSPSPPTSSAT